MSLNTGYFRSAQRQRSIARQIAMMPGMMYAFAVRPAGRQAW
jgi:hypothetical protein